MPLPQLTPLARREVDVVVGLDKPEAGRFVARKLTDDYTLGIYASAAYVKRNGAPADVEALRRHRLIGYVEQHAFSTALDYVREAYDGKPTSFESASAVTQLEALRAGVGVGVIHDFIARRFRDLVRVLPERRATRASGSSPRTRVASGAFARSRSIWRRRSRPIGRFSRESGPGACLFSCGLHCAVSPPSTMNSAPVVNGDSSLARKETVATSSALPDAAHRRGAHESLTHPVRVLRPCDAVEHHRRLGERRSQNSLEFRNQRARNGAPRTWSASAPRPCSRSSPPRPHRR